LPSNVEIYDGQGPSSPASLRDSGHIIRYALSVKRETEKEGEMAEVSFDKIVDELRKQDIPAYVEQTGGGVATIMVGEQTDREEPIYRWSEGNREQTGTQVVPRYDVLAGPGSFAGPGWTNAYGDTADLAVGPDDDGDSQYWTADPTRDTEEDVVAEIIRQYRRSTG
jgi:hypothetical protein